jgi:NTE family protein
VEKIQPFISKVVNFYRTTTLQGNRRLQIMLPQLFGFNENFGLADQQGFIELFKEEFGNNSFEDARIPLNVVATNFANGQRVLINQGLLWEAICASCCPLGLLPPLLVNGQMLIDGAASEPLPLTTATERRAKIIVALGFENPDIKSIQSLPNYTHQVRNIFVNQLLNAQIALCNLVYEGEIIPVIPKFGAMMSNADSQAFHQIIERGAEATETIVPYLKTLLAS